MLRAENITKRYKDRSAGGFRLVLDHCSLNIGKNEIVGLMGRSGCGKSTLARILLRLILETSGNILYNGEDITHYKESQLHAFRKQVQLISQRPESFFDPMKKLDYSLKEPLKIYDLQIKKEEIERVFEMVKLNTALLGRYPHEVSGGEIQRISLARSLLLNPKFLILDEPTSMLDISVQAQVLHLLKKIHKETKASFLLISHDPLVINWMADRVLQMENGQII